MKSLTYLKDIRISPKKLRFFLPAIKKLKPRSTLDFLFYARAKAAKILYQSVKSAINNAKSSLKATDDLLKFKLFTIEEGRKIRRFKPGGRGTAKPITKRFSHIKIILEAEKKEEPKSKLEVKNLPAGRQVKK